MDKRLRSESGEVRREELTKEFFARDTVTVAREIVGKVLEHDFGRGVASVIVSETEAYTEDEPSCHAFKGKTKRNWAMFEEPGTVYLYYIHGRNICMNVSTERSGKGCGVLLRASLPLRGEIFLGDNKKKVMNGPAKMTKKLGISFEYYGKSVLDGSCPLKFYDEGWIPVGLEITPRIGISRAQDLLRRFVAKDFKGPDSKLYKH